ncbi:MbnP family protein [Hymenobacter rubidus]|uniref:MbnP family protein n=1 Tax=Hymenobacter rubidus TaxID=1441626 RepID=UPI00191DC4DA|nr:MbnP family protein [Hymenobacter rubidus]
MLHRYFSFGPLASLSWAVLLAAALGAGCAQKTVEPSTGSFALEIDPVVGLDDLVLNTATYTKADGQTFTVSKFKFLLSGLKLTKGDGTSYAVPDGYYLVDAADDKTFHIVIDQVPLGDYTGLSFLLGVDDAHNNGTFVSGALNHNNDLYWDWSKEYVFLKMAGSSAQAPAGRSLTFDIGGAGVVRTVTPAFKGLTLPVKMGHVPEIHMYAHVEGLFNSATPANNINFATTYSVESGDPKALTVADNYAANMFTVEHIHAN